MSKYVIFVDEDLVSGSMQMAAAAANVAAPLLDGLALSFAQQLDLRKSVLGGLAATLFAGPGAAVAAFAGAATEASSAIAAITQAAADAAVPAAQHGIEILEGVSAIVVDDTVVDIAALANVVGITVYPNIELRLPTPVAVTADAVPPAGWHLSNIGLTQPDREGSDILIGILDTGIAAGHPEFAGKTIHFQEFDAVGRKVASAAHDAGEHGTHVSSIVAGKTVGVAPGADLAVAAVLTTASGGSMTGSLLQIVNGFDWLVKTQFRPDRPGVDVVNASLGGVGFNTYLRTAVQTAWQLGVPLIAAIGNNGRRGQGQHGSPGNYREVLSVGAIDSNNTVADFSDWGTGAPPAGPRYPLPELCAPGVQVYAAKPDGTYQRMSGTSMATPVVTGVAARRMAANAALVGHPAALFADLRRKLAAYTPGPLGNLGGAGRIIA